MKFEEAIEFLTEKKQSIRQIHWKKQNYIYIKGDTVFLNKIGTDRLEKGKPWEIYYGKN